MDVPPRCRLSDPVHPHTLSRRDNPPPSDCFKCGSYGYAFKDGDWHYYCDICELVFHNYCHTTLRSIRHPYHLPHFLNLTFRFTETKTQSIISQADYQEVSEKRILYLSSVFKSDNCDWCGTELNKSFFRCLVCGFSLHVSCAEKDPLFTITNPKSHQHPLNLFPRPLSVPCSACGLGDKTEEPCYVCLPCNYVVHESCINLPRVIKLTRHQHRLSHTPCLPPPAKRSCGVCQRNVDVKLGMYSCNKGCSYAVHSKCATHEHIWDGIDLERVPEEPLEDIEPFEEVGYNLIKHFSHEHHLIFDEDELDHDANKECQACCRSIDSGGFYGCTILHCDFFLHEPCANFPKKKEHPVHKHPLILLPVVRDNYYHCVACERVCTGFTYTCLNNTCNENGVDFQMDVRCASVCEPFEHKVHSHPLLLFSGRDSSSLCGICGIDEGNEIFTLKCNDCEFTMCFRCATIPVVIRYKHDEHLLTLSGGEDSTDPYWCEKCERQIDPKKWFYTCDECCTSLHIDCVFVDSSYIKIGLVGLDAEDGETTFASNNDSGEILVDSAEVLVDSAETLADSAEIMTNTTKIFADSAETLVDSTNILANSTDILADSANI